MRDCKNCPYTDEYCASGDCKRNADVSKTLTEKWEKGELPAGYYYIEAITGEKIIDFMPYNEKEFKIFPSHTSIVICEVPSYEEYEQLENWSRFTADYHALREAKEITEYEKVELLEKVKQLKDLLKECADLVSSLVVYETEPAAIKQLSELWQKIDEVLK